MPAAATTPTSTTTTKTMIREHDDVGNDVDNDNHHHPLTQRGSKASHSKPSFKERLFHDPVVHSEIRINAIES